MIFLIPFFLFFLPLSSLSSQPRGSSAPYISGDTFRAYCDFVYDELDQIFNPSKVKENDVIFVKTDLVGQFFREIHPRICQKYILLTHNSDDPIPGQYASYLDDSKILAWFGQNVENYAHPKLHPIPIGIANRCWDHGNITTIQKVQNLLPQIEKSFSIYMNFSETTFAERSLVASMFKEKIYCCTSLPKKPEEYLIDLAKTYFVLSPRGNGLDCHRTWEALLMGAIPVVKTSSLDSLYDQLPVIIIDSWETLDLPLLEQKYRELQTKTLLLDKIYIDHWLEQIEGKKIKDPVI